MDFYKISEVWNPKKKIFEIYPSFIIGRSKDLMVRGKEVYAIWDPDNKIWSTDEYDVQRLIDNEMIEYRNKHHPDGLVKELRNNDSKMWMSFKSYIKNLSDNYKQLDTTVTFLNDKVKKTDYVSKRLPYPLEPGPIDAYEELISTLYDPEERQKIEWAIGSIVANEAKNIQKFVVLYGESGSGKSTILHIIEKLFVGYYVTFEAKSLVTSGNNHAMEIFRSNPLVAIQHDGDLSKIDDNSTLNSLISHEEMLINVKNVSQFSMKPSCFLFMATNKPVKMTDAKSGLIRRIIDVHPSLRKLPYKKYRAAMDKINFELGAIAHHCLNVYRNNGGKNGYDEHNPIRMLEETNFFYNFVEEHFLQFKKDDGISLKQAYGLYKTYCDETNITYKMNMNAFRDELKVYFKHFDKRTRIERSDGSVDRFSSYYSGFLDYKFTKKKEEIIEEDIDDHFLILEDETSILDAVLASCQAQYTKDDETPLKPWDQVETKLSDIDSKKLHYVRPPLNHIVIDFDLVDENGFKSSKLNIEAASGWPSTYAEFSKSGSGIHLHYIYTGDVELLEREHAKGIEVKVFTGKSALRRKFTKSNGVKIASLNSGLLSRRKEGKKTVINFESVNIEKGLRTTIAKNLNKDIHPGTKPSIDHIYKILEDAYKSGAPYDVTDLRPKILAFANNSTNQADYCIKLVNKMRFASEEVSVGINNDNTVITFYDVEVFPNLFIVVWKYEGEDKPVIKMVNPTSEEIEKLFQHKLVGFNCRRYDNHILYARFLGYDNKQLYDLSQKIIDNNKSRNAFFGEAYNISYTDVYCFSSKKQSLKKFQLELGIHHRELGLPWDVPVPEERWTEVADYCVNDVLATEAVFNDRKQDFVARQILADLSGLSVNDTTQTHTAKIIFGNDKNPQDKFNYVDLREMFPGYIFENGRSTYKGEETGEGGYVYAEPGMYSNVTVLDVASMHPTSLVNMNMFGPYTSNFKDLLDARLAIKHKNYDLARGLLSGILAKYLTNSESSKELSYALKIIINIVYGLTSATFDNKFKDPRNKDNIVAKRGALFMIDLKEFVQSMGGQVIHIKTDSIKIPNASDDLIAAVMDFGESYGYTFEHEDTFEKICLVNDAVYIAKIGWSLNEKTIGTWNATGAQFAHPYVFKTLFSNEPVLFEDMCESKTVTTALYLDMNEMLGENEHNYHFVGKAGMFCPIKSGCGGGILLRVKGDKYYAAGGSKGYRWLESELVRELGREDDIDRKYFDELVDDAITNISRFGSFEWFVNGIETPIGFDDCPPWCPLDEPDPQCLTCINNNGCVVKEETCTGNCSTCPKITSCTYCPS